VANSFWQTCVNLQILELLDLEADVNQANQAGVTPLLHAAYHGHVGTVMLLLQHGADNFAVTCVSFDVCT
jgi:ankyrin repeat protein